MSGSVSGLVVGLSRVWLGLGLVVSLTAALLVGLPSSVGAVAGPYSDVAATHDHVDSITRLKDLGVFDGIELAFCEEGNFCPDTPINRKTFSVWLIRILDGDDAPDFVGAGGGSDFDFGAILADPGLYGLLGPAVIDWLTPRFEDVSKIHPFHNFVERLADLEIAGGCSQEPARFCPDDAIPRNQMAGFFVRAFDLAEANETRFVDVESDSPHHENINRLVATTIDLTCTHSLSCPGQATTKDPGCGYPSRFCPGDTISRARMASLLARAIDWRDAQAEVETNGSDDSIGLGVTYDEEEYEATVSWSAPTASNGQVKHYVLQSRLILEDFGPKFYQIVETESNQTSYQVTVPSTNSNSLYAFRVIVVYEDGKKLATTEVKTPSSTHKLRDVIKGVVEAKQDQQPWLGDVWLHMNGRSRFGIGLGRPSVSLRGEYPYPNGLKRTFASGLGVGSATINLKSSAVNGGMATLVHEMGHVYTLTNDVRGDSAPIGVAHLYLSLLGDEHAVEARDPPRCSPSELYADLAVLAFFDQYSYFDPRRGLTHGLANGVSMTYWGSCGFRFDQSTSSAVAAEIPAITKSVFIDQEIPQWFYDTYQKTDGSIDLEKLWSDISSDGYETTMSPIAYHLRNEFGGYCSEEQVRQFIEGKATGITNPWKDGGCNDDVVVEGEDSSSSTNSTVIPNAPDISGLASYGSYSLDFLQELYNKPDRCWIAINRYVYDVTPGDEGYNYPGPGQVTDLCGQDASDHFSSNNLGYPPIKYLKGYLRSR